MSKRLHKERLKLDQADNKLQYVADIELVDDSIFTWDCTILGPSDSPYAGGKFVLRLDFPSQYPFKAPKLVFQTKIYHPSVQTSSGEVCGDVLGTWAPTLNAQHCLTVVYSLMCNPKAGIEHPLEEEIANLIQKKPKEFEKNAKKMTKEHAK